MLQPPPFKFASTVTATQLPAVSAQADRCCVPRESAESGVSARAKLADLDPHLHCSVLGTCLGTAELRKAMARFTDVQGVSDLDVHHDAVRLTSEQPQVAKLLHKTLDKRHEAVMQRFALAKAPDDIGLLWEEALRQGEVPGACWALLTHRKATPVSRQRAFGDVHMLSHLVGAADIRRLVALERDNAELRERLDRQQLRSQQLQLT